MKRLIAIMMAAALLLCAFAAAENEIIEGWNIADDTETESLNAEDEVGAWMLTDLDTCKGGEELKEMFDRAVAELTGVTYTPAAVLATQSVNGSNYCILAHCDYTDDDVKTTGWSLVYISEAFGGEVQVTNVVDIDIAALADYGLLHN